MFMERPTRTVPFGLAKVIVGYMLITQLNRILAESMLRLSKVIGNKQWPIAWRGLDSHLYRQLALVSKWGKANREKGQPRKKDSMMYGVKRWQPLAYQLQRYTTFLYFLRRDWTYLTSHCSLPRDGDPSFPLPLSENLNVSLIGYYENYFAYLQLCFLSSVYAV